MIVDRKWPTWKLFAIFGDEYSMTTFLPWPDLLVPYEGSGKPFEACDGSGVAEDEEMPGCERECT